MVKYVLKLSDVPGRIALEPPLDTGARENIKHELRKCREKHGGFVLLTIEPPKKPRTTGPQSQNHHLNGHIMQICNETGNSYEVVKYCVKMIAVEQLGYPSQTIAGHIIPQPEADASTDECALLIEAAHILAADIGIILQE